MGWNGDPSCPVVVLEAKVMAAFAENQVACYIDQQERQLAAAGEEPGIFGLVVPGERVPEATRLAKQTLADRQRDLNASDGDRTEDKQRVSLVVVSWDDIIEAALSGQGTMSQDLEQLLGACRALPGSRRTGSEP